MNELEHPNLAFDREHLAQAKNYALAYNFPLALPIDFDSTAHCHQHPIN